MATSKHTPAQSGERGLALVLSIILALVLSGLCAGLTLMATSLARQTQRAVTQARLRCVAEGAVNHNFAILDFGDALVPGNANKAASAAATGAMGGLDYSVATTDGAKEPTLDDNLISLVGAATNGSDRCRVQRVIRKRIVSVAPALFGDQGVTLLSNSLVDSYDSRLGTYDAQAVNLYKGTYPYATAKSAVGSNKNVSLDSNSMVFGDAKPGPTGTTTVLGNSYVSGSKTPNPSIIAVPAVPPKPVIASSGNLSFSSGTKTLGPGNVRHGTVSITGDTPVLTLKGPMVWEIASATFDGDVDIIADVTNGPVSIYVTSTLEFKAQAYMRPTSMRPGDLSLYFIPAAKTALFDSNVRFVGQLTAPSSSVQLKSNVQVWGAVRARTVTLDSNSELHYDLLLSEVSASDPGGVYETQFWRPLPN